MTTTKTPTTVSVTAGALISALRSVAVAVAPRPRSVAMEAAVTAAVTLTVANGLLTISGFDYETGAIVRVPAGGTEDFTIAVNHAELSGLLRYKPKAALVTLVASEEPSVLLDNALLGTLTSIDPGAMPRPDISSARPFTVVGGRALMDAIARVAPAASDEPSYNLPQENKFLRGVALDGTTGGFTVYATDRYRLAAVDLIVSAREDVLLIAADRLRKAVKTIDPETEVTLTDTAFYLRLDQGERTIFLMKMSERYRDVLGLFREHREHTVFARSEMVAAIDEVAQGLVNEKVVLRRAQGGLLVTSENGDHVFVVTDSSEGFPEQIAFTSKYLLGALSGKTVTQVTITANSGHGPVTILRDDEPTARQLLMPVRL